MSPKNWVLVTLAAASLASGVIDQYFYPGQPFPPSAVGFMVVGVLLIFLWYRMDTAQIGYRRSPWLNVGAIALAVVALPYYFFRSRGALKGAVATGALVLAYIASGMLTVAGSYLAYYGLQT